MRYFVGGTGTNEASAKEREGYEGTYELFWSGNYTVTIMTDNDGQERSFEMWDPLDSSSEPSSDEYDEYQYGGESEQKESFERRVSWERC